MNPTAGLNPHLVLRGEYVRLEPMTPERAPELFAIAQDDEIWRWLPAAAPSTLAAMEFWVAEALVGHVSGRDLPFVVIDAATNRVIGSTRYLAIVPEHRQLEIGWTWYGIASQRTTANTECKYLLLRYAFESLGCIRVYFTTDLRNERSQRAIERIGAVKEGVLRKYRVVPKDGYLRSSVMYWIIEDEWPAVKARLESLLRQRDTEISAEQGAPLASVKPEPQTQIKYRRTRNLPLKQVERLWRSVGWWTREESPTLLPAALAHSHTVVSAWDGDLLIGVANALADGHLVVYYPYIVVDPAYQHQGVGSRLVEILKARYAGYRQQVLLSVKDAVAFYEQRGFALSEPPGMQIHNFDV